MRVVVDCGNGAAFRAAPLALRALGAEVEVLHAAPDGSNINDGCGSTHPEELQAAVVAAGAQIGLAFDGDADRVIAVDEQGELIDGDQVIAITAIDLHDRGLLRGNAVVDHRDVQPRAGAGARPRTASSSCARRSATATSSTSSSGATSSLGGEQSGHVINMLHAGTGDGTLTGIVLLDVMARRERPLSELAAVMTRLPQVLRNVAFDDPEALNSDTVFWSRVRDIDDELGDDGRVLVRLSGTEPLARVMVESRDLADAESAADRLVALIEHVARGEGRSPAPRFTHYVWHCWRRQTPRRRTPPDPTALAADLVERARGPQLGRPAGDRLGGTATLVSAVDSALRGAPGVRALLGAPNVSAALDERLGDIWLQLDAIERDLDLGAAAAMGAAEIELVNSALIRARDAVWAVRHDRLARRRGDRRVHTGSDAAIDAYVSIYVALSSLDRLEVRGRDSAGLHVFVRGHDLDLDAADVRELLVAAHRRPAVHVGVGSGAAELPVVRVQGRRRDR